MYSLVFPSHVRTLVTRNQVCDASSVKNNKDECT
jgi:hypothetical protein